MVSPGNWEVKVEKSCCNDIWAFLNPGLHKVSNLVQWLTKKSNGWRKDQLNENEATISWFFLREINMAQEVFFVGGALYFNHG